MTPIYILVAIAVLTAAALFIATRASLRRAARRAHGSARSPSGARVGGPSATPVHARSSDSRSDESHLFITTFMTSPNAVSESPSCSPSASDGGSGGCGGGGGGGD